MYEATNTELNWRIYHERSLYSRAYSKVIHSSYWRLYVRTDIRHPGVAKYVSLVQPPVSVSVGRSTGSGTTDFAVEQHGET